MEIIRDRIRELRCKNTDDQWFVPEGSLATCLTPSILRQLLSDHCEVESYRVDEVARVIEYGGRKAFAVLILIRGEKCITSLIENHDNTKLDARMPSPLEVLERYFPRKVAEEFEEVQWQFVVPVFVNRLSPYMLA
jgi:hypothetical protein